MKLPILLLLTLGALAFAMETPFVLISYQKLTARPPDIAGPAVKVWTVIQNKEIRVNYVEMSGELKLHKHPDAAHSLMLLEGKVRVQIKEEIVILEKGDFISIPANVPHKYWALTTKANLVSMDAPYYDPAKTILLE